MSNNRWTLAAAWLLLLPASALPAAGNARFTIDVWGTDEGLPQNSVIAMTQTRDGYLWLGTLDGLVRFDGIRFTVFKGSDNPGLNSSRIIKLFEDSHDNLWIGTETAGVAFIKDGLAKSLDIGGDTREGRLTSACEDSSGAVWLYTADGQLGRYRDGRMEIGNFAAQQFSSYRQVIQEKSGPLWVGVDWGLYGFGTNASFESRELPLEHVLPAAKLDFVLASDREGYWRLADGRVQKWKTNRLELDLGTYPWGSAPVSAACEDQQGNLVVGTRGAGLCWFDAEGKATCLSTKEGLSNNHILSLHTDREGSLWVGTDGGGLNRIKRKGFDAIEESRLLVVQSVCDDGQGGLWIGSNGGEVGHLKGGELKWFGTSQGLMDFSVRAVFVDRNQKVWVGTWSAVGPGLFQLHDGRFQQAPGSEVVNPEVSAIYQDRSGKLWVGTQGGLACWSENTWKVFTTREGLSSDVVRAVIDDREGNLWIGTGGGGLNRMREGRFTKFRRTDGLPNDNISSLYADEDGVLWIGTSSGLGRFHDGRWTRYTTREGLISNSIGYLIEDGQGYLWIGSYAGLMRVEKKSLNDVARGLATSVLCRTYGKQDGLQTGECTQGSQPAACRTDDGKLWFPTVKGLVSINPAQLNRNTNQPPVIIESVLIEGQEQNTNGLRAARPLAITIPASKERLDIQYTSLNLAAADRARFKYRMEGLDRMEGNETRWTDAGKDRIVRYPKLPPGSYRFQVTACNEDGVWNQAGSALAVTVLPPFWQTWWFLTTTALGLLGVVVAGVHYLSTQKLQRQLGKLRQQEALEKERSRIARDLHDQLGANLTQVSLLGEMVEADKDSPTEVEAHGRQISQTSRETTRALDEIVWAANPSNDTLDGLITYACKYAQEYLAVAGLRYRLDAPSQLPAASTPPEVRHNVFLAFKEAINNIVKHAQASAVQVRLRLEANRFTLEVEDDGRGPVGMDEKTGRNGLRNMRKRMEDIGGGFSISPGADGGTLVKFTAPYERR